MVKAKRAKETKANFEYDLVMDNKSSAALDRVETAAYISDIVLQLRNMAKAADLRFLVYFLEMAFQEAFSQSTRKEGKTPQEPKA